MKALLEILCCAVLGFICAVMFFIIFFSMIAYSVSEDVYNWANKKVGVIYASML